MNTNNTSNRLIGFLTPFTIIVALTSTPGAYADLLFVGKVMGPVANVYSVDHSGNVTKVTDNIRWRDMEPDITSDSRIAFMSNREKDERVNLQRKSENYNIFITDKKNKKLKQITDSPGQEVSPKFSPDNTKLGFLRDIDNKREIGIITLSNNKEKILAKAEYIYGYSWSPDGKKLTYAATSGDDSTLEIIDIETGKTEILVKVSKLPVPADAKRSDIYLSQIASAQWSPDGKKIAFIKHPFSKNTARQLKVYDLKTKADQIISVDGAQVQDGITWSKDSKKLLYSALINYKFYYDETIHKKVYEGGMHIFLSELNGKSQQLTKGDYLFKRPVFSPDEKRIAYLYADKLDARALSLKTMNIDGSDSKQLHKSVAPASSLKWY